MDSLQSLRNAHHEQWKRDEEIADKMIPLIGHLYRYHNVIITLFGNGLVHKNGLEIIQLHQFVSQNLHKVILLADSFLLLQAFARHCTKAHSMRIDLGRTFIIAEKFVLAARENANEGSEAMRNLAKYLDSELDKVAASMQVAESLCGTVPMHKPCDIVLYGFGRIGRLLARLLIEKSGPGVKLMLRAIVVRKGSTQDLMKRVNLLKLDSVHGPFSGTIELLENVNAFVANGNLVQILYSDAPNKINYESHGIHDAVIIDNTGRWRDERGLALHLQAPGASKVILTAPAKDKIPTIVAGVNDAHMLLKNCIFSAASCTTNAVTPVLLALDTKFGIVRGHIESVHSYTNDQNLIDNYHQKERRGRSAVLNMVITETGAAQAIVDCLPSLANKLTANAIRVPTPNVSLAILNIDTRTEDLSADKVNAYMRSISFDSSLQNQIDFVDSAEMASSDFVGCRAAGTIDGKATIVQGNKVILYVWYDNEFGYSCQVIRLLQKLKGIVHPHFPDETQMNALPMGLCG